MNNSENFTPPHQDHPNRGEIHIPVQATESAPEHTRGPVATAEQLEQLESEAAAWQDKYTRLYAELENTKKRLARNYANQAEEQAERLLRDMLPLADNLERALTHTAGKETEAGLRQGVEITLSAFADALAKHGVRVIQAQGQPFDPEWHEAVGAIPHRMLSPGTVVRVEQKGYTFHDRVLRPARVWIASG
jgi:molecular chaperone GrpE